MEFFAVINNPRRVTNARTSQEAREEMEKYAHAARIGKIHPSDDVVEQMLTLRRQYSQVKGPEVFDRHLVATMQSNGVRRIYTYNKQHFDRFQGIEILTP